ncbi:hypothetical protein [Acidaminococcus timonensis]|uniref:hypothetical protein n=1 Tax=Acidaminococcus timonensis TaxID=1871002 RepID=UPI0026E98E32|nr:hypothetical protein [Acidaminococcus timonensis]
MQSNLKNLAEELRGKYILCICEGKAEEAIINLLLENDCLVFQKQDLLNGKCTTIRTAARIEEEFLRLQYKKEVAIVRILDRDKEKFTLSKLYRDRFPVYSICTKPEIEILHLIYEGKWHDYKKHKMKPSVFFHKLHPGESIKSEDFVESFYGSYENLIHAICEYHRITSYPAVYDLSDLLKPEVKRKQR